MSILYDLLLNYVPHHMQDKLRRRAANYVSSLNDVLNPDLQDYYYPYFCIEYHGRQITCEDFILNIEGYHVEDKIHYNGTYKPRYHKIKLYLTTEEYDQIFDGQEQSYLRLILNDDIYQNADKKLFIEILNKIRKYFKDILINHFGLPRSEVESLSSR